MLIYLNGRDNIGSNPNENYARELLELFTIGVGQYKQADVEAIAKALTGWKASTREYEEDTFAKYPDDTVFKKSDHQWSNIALFGQLYDGLTTVPADDTEAKTEAHKKYLWVHDRIFEQKEQEAATFICRKLYTYYLYHQPNDAIINGMTETLINNNWELAPVLKEFFTSEHFFEEQAIGAKIKSPLSYFTSFYRQTGLKLYTHWYHVDWALNPNFDPNKPFHIDSSFERHTNQNLAGHMSSNSGGIGQLLFLPPTVAGWAGNRSWINEFTLTKRWNLLKIHLEHSLYLRATEVRSAVDEQYLALMKNLSNDSKDPYEVSCKLIEHYISIPLDNLFKQAAYEAFIQNVPENYIEQGRWFIGIIPGDKLDAAKQFRDLLIYLARLPEFQLN